MIKINQDKLGEQGRLISSEKEGKIELYGCKVQGGYAVVVFNRDHIKNNFKIKIDRDLEIKGSYRVRDIIDKKDIGIYHQNILDVKGIEIHGVKVLKIMPVA